MLFRGTRAIREQPTEKLAPVVDGIESLVHKERLLRVRWVVGSADETSSVPQESAVLANHTTIFQGNGGDLERT